MNSNPYRLIPNGSYNRFDVYKHGAYMTSGTWQECKKFIADDEQADYLKNWKPKGIHPLVVKCIVGLGIIVALIVVSVMAACSSSQSALRKDVKNEIYKDRFHNMYCEPYQETLTAKK